MSTYSQLVIGNKPAIVDLKNFTNIQIETAALKVKPEGAKKVDVFISFIPVENSSKRKKAIRKEEKIATFDEDTTVTSADYIVTDEMEASVYTVDGAEVLLSGIYLAFSDDEYGVPEEEEESVDEDFHESESD